MNREGRASLAMGSFLIVMAMLASARADDPRPLAVLDIELINTSLEPDAEKRGRSAARRYAGEEFARIMEHSFGLGIYRLCALFRNWNLPKRGFYTDSH